MAPRLYEFCVTVSRMQSTHCLAKEPSRYLSDDRNEFDNRRKFTTNNNNNQDDVYRAVIMANHSRVHPIHLMNAD